ncbi:hypothetical protein BDN70DRAFT_917980 [Pholiota conissans]|uniref:F-box domain-containing protein n=1 Tax=Pholiota conissans TaxID=109636 RepID=A0A9P5ZC15_9AGAR|nr:hypothetical protein BDN70DRAFT_917980 [Pholiota conissans]
MAPPTPSHLIRQAKSRVESKRRQAPSTHPGNSIPSDDKGAPHPQKRRKSGHTSSASDSVNSSSALFRATQPHYESKGQQQRCKAADCEGLVQYDGAQSKGEKVEELIDRFTELPLDVLFEIFKYLHPFTLLNISYTSKAMRFMLTAGYSTLIWKTAYAKNVHPNYFGHHHKYPPECPPGVDIRHYTSVVFGETCLFCGRSKATTVHWGALTRLCDKCANRKCVNYFNVHHRGFLIDTSCIDDKAYEISKLCWLSIPSSRITNPPGPSEKRVRKNMTFTQPLVSWGDMHLRERNASPQERTKWLKDRLTKEGYKHRDLERMLCNLQNLPLTQASILLNDDGWDIIKNKARAIFETERQRKRRDSMINIYRQRLSFIKDLVKETLKDEPKPWIRPSTSTLAKMEPILSIIKTIKGNDDEDVTKARLVSGAADFIPDFLRAWRSEADEFLCHLLIGKATAATSVDKTVDSTAPLKLATTFFKCRFCTNPISYPRILMHKCLRTGRKITPPDGEEAPIDSDEDKPEHFHGVPNVTEKEVWNKMSRWASPTWHETLQFISVDEAAMKSAKAITETCVEDPDTVTAEAMKDRKVWLECKRCSLPQVKGKARSREIMNRNMAILHDISVHPDDISTQGWSLVTSSPYLAIVEAQEASTFIRRKKEMSHERCRHCDAVMQTPSDAVSHLIRKHKVTLAALQDHLYTHLDTPMEAFACVVKI